MGWSFKVFMLTAVGWSEHVGDDEGALLQIIQSGRTRETQKSFIATVAPPERQYTQYHEMNCYASAGATSLQHDLDFVGPTVSVADCMDACNSDATCSCVTVHETGGCWKRMSCTPSKCAHGSGWHTFTVNEELPQTSAPSGEMQPHIANCVHVHASGTRCTTCEEGYTPGQWSAAGTCRKCTCASDTCNCATCSAQGYCTSCKEGYVFDGAPQPHLERCNLPDPAPIPFNNRHPLWKASLPNQGWCKSAEGKFGGYCRAPKGIFKTPDDCFNYKLKGTVAVQFRDGGCDFYRLKGAAPKDCPKGFHAGRGTDTKKAYKKAPIGNANWAVFCKITQ